MEFKGKPDSPADELWPVSPMKDPVSNNKVASDQRRRQTLTSDLHEHIDIHAYPHTCTPPHIEHIQATYTFSPKSNALVTYLSLWMITAQI